MINVAPIRAAAAAAPGDMVAVTKDQLEQLLSEVEEGQHAKRHLQMLDAIGSIGAPVIAHGHRVGISPSSPRCEAQ